MTSIWDNIPRMRAKSFDEVDTSAINNLKYKLESYSNELVLVYKQLYWKKIEDSYPLIIFTSILYLFVWKFSIPLLCLFFLSLQCFVLCDYFHVKSKSKKEGPKCKEFDELCRVLYEWKKYFQETMYCYFVMKEENPFWTCALTSAVLISLAVSAKLLGDICFSFIVLNTVLYFPGLEANGYLDKATVYVFSGVANVLRSFQGKKEKSN